MESNRTVSPEETFSSIMRYAPHDITDPAVRRAAVWLRRCLSLSVSPSICLFVCIFVCLFEEKSNYASIRLSF